MSTSTRVSLCGTEYRSSNWHSTNRYPDRMLINFLKLKTKTIFNERASREINYCNTSLSTLMMWVRSLNRKSASIPIVIDENCHFSCRGAVVPPWHYGFRHPIFLTQPKVCFLIPSIIQSTRFFTYPVLLCFSLYKKSESFYRILAE